MIDLETIEREISELEARQPSYKACERLSWLYIVRDHLYEKIYPQDGGERLKTALSGSEFLDASSGKPYEDVMKIMDEHMEMIKMLYPKTYSALVDKIREL